MASRDLTRSAAAACRAASLAALRSSLVAFAGSRAAPTSGCRLRCSASRRLGVGRPLPVVIMPGSGVVAGAAGVSALLLRPNTSPAYLPPRRALGSHLMTQLPVAPDVDALRRRLAAEMPGVRADLEALVRIPSVSAPAFDQQQVERSAAAVAELLRGAGLPEVEILRVPGGAPAVVARRPAPAGAPTVLLYAHHDVQPPGDPALWDSPAFEPVERNGRLYGRGASDDKAGIALHLAALRTLADDVAVGVTVFVEGEEEIGSPTFATFLATYRERLAADVIVVAD